MPLNILQNIKTPAYVLDEANLIKNLENIADVRKRSGAKIILALKGYSMFKSFPLMKPYLDGTTASGIYEAKLGAEYFGKEVHVYSPAYDDEEIDQLINVAHHIIFNSPSQLKKYAPIIKAKNPKIHIGLRVNPELQQVETSLYNPCAPCSRMGSVASEINNEVFEHIDGLHFHILCESMAEASVNLIDLVEEKFGTWLSKIKWVNFGGGHYINHPNYDKEKLINRIKAFKQKFNLDVILEPGGTMVYNAGYLVSTVLDIIKNDKQILILDTSATAHMPDVLEMPYRPNLFKVSGFRDQVSENITSSSLQGGEANRLLPLSPSKGRDKSEGMSGIKPQTSPNPNLLPLKGEKEYGAQPNEKHYNYLLGGRTCLTGDVIGEYSFDNEVRVGDKIIFTDMMQYSFVKNTTFNGIPLPDLGILKTDGSYEVYRSFGYEDFKNRLS